MDKLTLDTDLQNKLNGLNEPMEVCDEAGHTIGHRDRQAADAAGDHRPARRHRFHRRPPERLLTDGRQHHDQPAKRLLVQLGLAPGARLEGQEPRRPLN